jgi:hypothetical protein
VDASAGELDPPTEPVPVQGVAGATSRAAAADESKSLAPPEGRVFTTPSDDIVASVIMSARFAMSSRAYTLALSLGFAAVVALQLLGSFDRQPYDDAWFFKRFAINLVDQGTLAWNASDGPVYGNTSQLVQLPATVVTALARDHYAAAMRIILAAALLLGFVLMLRHAAREREDSAAAVALIFASPVVLFTVLSGMETALVLLALAWFLWILPATGSRGVGLIAAPAAMVGIYLLRPDAIVLAGLAWAWDRLIVRRQIPWREGLAFAALFGCSLLALKLFYGTALPLSFYLKSGAFTVYSETFIEMSVPTKRSHAALLLITALPLVYVAVQRLSRQNLGYLIAAAAFVGYHYVSTVEVMGGHARFYAPAVPLIAAAALPALGALAAPRRWPLHGSFLLAYTGLVAWLLRAEILPNDGFWIIERVQVAHYAGYVLGAWILIAVAPRRPRSAAFAILAVAAVSVAIAHPPRAPSFPSDEAYLDAQLRQRSGFRDIRELGRCLGDDIGIYHSEIGLPGVMYPRAHITDLAALMTPQLAFGDASFDDLCLADEPEVIYLPHRNYDWLNREIRESECLRGYRQVRGDSSSPLYLRADLVADYRQCAPRRH